MGVFLSKPSVTKFSEDGEDDAVRFGVSSMQGWRRGMEDAHLASLDVGRKAVADGAADGAAGEGLEGGEGDPIRIFGVFDGHGGKEVALFVQEHMAEELIKLQEYKSGNYAGALARVFHRMDELLEGAANELRRSQGLLPQEGGEMTGTQRSAWELDEGQEGIYRDGDGDVDCGGEGKGGEGSAGGGKGGTVQGGAEGQTRGGVSAERCKEILLELAEFRSRKNPSDLEAEGPPSKGGRPMLGSPDEDYDSDEDDDAGGADPLGREGRLGVDRGVDNSSSRSDDGSGSNSGVGDDGDGSGKKIKMADALELFHRILDIRKDHHQNNHHPHQQQRTTVAAVEEDEDEEEEEGKGGEATPVDPSSCEVPPPLSRTRASSATADDGNEGTAREDRLGKDEEEGVVGDAAGDDEDVTPSADTAKAEAPPPRDDGQEGGLLAESGEGATAWPEEEVGARELILPEAGSEAYDDEGEDTFGDSDESEEEDVLLTPADANAGGAGPGRGGGGARPRLGLGASLASLVHGTGGNAPTCTLDDHPIQAGCTSVVCLMVGKYLHIANAGDSRAVLCRGGEAMALSHDHKPLSDIEKNRIERAGGFVNAAGRVNGNLNLSRSIGDLKYKANSALSPADQMITAEPDLKLVELTDKDQFMILACDGVWDCMSSQECVDFVGSRVGKMPLSKVCEEVMDACLSEDPRRTTGIGGDNMTCIVVLLDTNLTAVEDVPSSSRQEAMEEDAEDANRKGTSANSEHSGDLRGGVLAGSAGAAVAFLGDVSDPDPAAAAAAGAPAVAGVDEFKE